LEELKNEKQNTDRRDALRLAVLLKAIWQANGHKKRRVIKPTNQPKQVKKFRGVNLLEGAYRRQTKKQRTTSLL
jgi:hypothetical protein